MFKKEKDTTIGHPNGRKNHMRSPEEKERIVLRYLKGNMSICGLAKDESVDDKTLGTWIHSYEKYGIEGLKSKTGKCGSGNPYAALHTKKELTEVERLRLELAKKEVECERLKKGYSVKGVGRRKEYVIINKKNSK